MQMTLAERIDRRLDAVGLKAQAASLKAGLSRDYLRSLKNRNPGAVMGSGRAEDIMRIARVLRTTPEWLLRGEGPEEASPPPGQPAPAPAFPAQAVQGDVRPANAPPLPARYELPNDVPVMGTAAGSLLRGAFQFEGGVVDYVRRPPGLINARDIYALYVEGASMEPQFNPGDLVYVNPHKPARFGDAVIVQMKHGEHEPEEATIGVFKERNAETIVVLKHNPPKTLITLRRDRILAIHKVLTVNELFGL